MPSFFSLFIIESRKEMGEGIKYMAAFDRVKSGIPAMDQALDYIRLGDNVVLQVSRMEEFCFFNRYTYRAQSDLFSLCRTCAAGKRGGCETVLAWIRERDLNSLR